MFGRRQYGQNPPKIIRYYFFVVLPNFIFLSVPPALQKLWGELDDYPLNVWKRGSSSPPLISRSRMESRKTVSKVNSLRVLANGTDRQNSIQMIDVSVPTSPVLRPSRTPSVSTDRKVPSLWDGTMSALAGTNSNLRRTSAAFTREVDGMRRKGQCSLEWEYLATVLDRFLLIVFIGAVILITGGLMVVGKMAQYDYDHPPMSFSS